MSERLGIMGGTFNPIHEGHLAIARIAREEFHLNRVLFLPDGNPPHKTQLASKWDRLKMVQLAVRDEPGFEVCTMEVEREGTTYTVDTLRELRQRCATERFFYIVGADTVAVMHLWKQFEQVARLTEIIAVPRPQQSMETLNTQIELLKQKYDAQIHLTQGTGPEISSTQVRERVAQNDRNELPVPDAVECYIRSRGLYLPSPVGEALLQLREQLSNKRIRHTLGVVQTACELAKRYCVDPLQAELAAALHDCARGMSYEKLMELADDAGADTIERTSLALLHAPVGALWAKRQYGVTDEQVLSAIRWHTTGKPNMTALQKVVYLADMIEPNREEFPGLARIRQEAQRDLNRAVKLAAESTVRYVRARDLPLHERTLSMLDDRSLDRLHNKEEAKL